MIKNEIKVLAVIGVVTIAMVGFFWWLGLRASRKEMENRRSVNARREEEKKNLLAGRAVDAGTGKPLRGIAIIAHPASSSGSPGKSAVQKTVTGAGGLFTLRNPSGGPMAIESDDNFYFLPAPVILTPGGPPGEEPKAGTGGKGSSPRRVVFRRGGMIEGSVLDPSGKFCAHALVFLEIGPGPGKEAGEKNVEKEKKTGKRPWKGPPFLKTATGETGGFLFRGVPPGIPLKVTAFHPDWAPSPAAVLVVGAGRRRPLSLSLSRGEILAGRVLDAAKKPVAGALVYPCAPAPDRTPLLGAPFLSPSEGVAAGLAARSGPGGAFRLHLRTSALTGGGASGTEGGGKGATTLSLAARAPGRVTGHAGGIAGGAGGFGPSPVEIVLPASAFISGRVVNEKGEPLAGVLARAVATAGKDVYSAGRSTAEDGAFRLGPLPASLPAEVTFSAPGMAEKRMSAVTPGGKALEVTLEAGATLKGSVTEADTSEPVPSFRAFLQRRDGGEGMIRTGRGKEGSFVFEGLPAGTYGLSISARGHESLSVPGLVLHRGEEKKLAALALHKITGISGSAALTGGGPLAGVRVEPLLILPGGLARSLPEKGVLTGKDGGFSITGLAPGKYTLRLFRKSPPLLWRKTGLDVSTGKVLEGIPIEAGREGGSLEVLVLGRDKKALPGVRVLVEFDDEKGPLCPPPGSFETDGEGKVRLDSLPPGDWTVTAVHHAAGAGGGPPGGKAPAAPWGALVRVTRPVAVARGGVAKATLSFADLVLVDVSGTITAGGAPPGLCRLEAVPLHDGIPDPDGARTADVDVNGDYSLPALPEGRYFFSIVNGGVEPVSRRPVTVGPKGGAMRLDFDLEAGSIAGTVRSKATGKPLPKASVFLYRAGGGAGPGTSVQAAAGIAGPDGAFLFTGLKAGEYAVAALGAGAAGRLEKIVLKTGSAARGLVVTAAPAGGLAVTAGDEKGAPLRGATVFAEKKGEGIATAASRGLALANDAGEVFFSPLEPGKYRVVAGAPERLTHVEGAVKVEAGKTARVAAPLTKGEPVTLQLKNEKGEPVTRCLPALFGPDGLWIGPPAGGNLFQEEGRTSGTGKYLLGAYPPGKYRLHVAAGGYEAVTVSVVVPGKGGMKPVVLTLKARE